MPKLYIITEWIEQSWWNTGGTRDKKIYLNPEDGQLYFFKQSFKSGDRDYKYEFWSEIIASEIGIQLGFDVLPYHIAIRDEVVGCISKSMIDQASEELIEGGKYLQAFDSNFKPENTKERHKYNFDLIINALTSLNKERHIKELIETIVFDALIGNSDRHQENWAIINTHTLMSESVSQVAKSIENKEIEKYPKWLNKFLKFIYTKQGKIRPEIERSRLMLPKVTRFAPIYDSGCSFGRELKDERVSMFLSNKDEIKKYVSKGSSEIHWENNKVTHFELISNLLQLDGIKEVVLSCLKRVTEKFDKSEIEKHVLNVDVKLQEIGNTNILPKERKQLVLELLDLRYQKLKEIYDQYS